MSWLLFLDESGHDHKQLPYEVRGGIALQDSQLWPFVQAMQRLELDCFGGQLHQFRKELKGSTLLDRKRFKFARQAEPMAAEASAAVSAFCGDCDLCHAPMAFTGGPALARVVPSDALPEGHPRDTGRLIASWLERPPRP